MRFRSGGVAGGRADPVVVGSLTGHCLVDQPSAAAAKRRAHARSDGFPAHTRAQNVGVFRDIRRSRGPLAAARQRAGPSDDHGRASDVADQYGARTACESGRARFRLPDDPTTGHAHGKHAAHHAIAGALSGPFLQLVRHPDATTADARLCLDGGQRQPRGPSADVAPRTVGAL